MIQEQNILDTKFLEQKINNRNRESLLKESSNYKLCISLNQLNNLFFLEEVMPH